MAWRIVLLLLLTLASWSTRPAGAAVGDEPFTEAQLRELLKHNPQTGRPVNSVSELVPLLPDELRRNFTFVYDSRSPFKAAITPQLPRVILFTDDGRLVLTFIGDEQQPGADLLETMTFDDAQAKFVMNAYLLPAAQRRAWRPSELDAKCARCHGADPRPIFDSDRSGRVFTAPCRIPFPRTGSARRRPRTTRHSRPARPRPGSTRT